MREGSRRAGLVRAWGAGLCLCAGLAQANNGINQIGFGTESALMAGADAAMARDTAALNTNPAGLAHTKGGRVDVYAGAAYFMDAAHGDSLGNDRQVSNRVVPVAGLGLAQRLGGSPVVAAAGVFVQGGAGADFRDLRTPFGNRDDLSSLFGVGKLMAGLSWEVTQTLSLGVAVSRVMAAAEQRIFPQTSSAAPQFFGVAIDDLQASRTAFRLGAQYQVSPTLRLGAVFANRVALPLEDGTARVNLGAVGLGTVTYRNARVGGFGLPREISLGAAWQATETTLLSVKVSRLGWSRALGDSVTQLSDPDNPFAPATIQQVQSVTARDRTMIAVGVKHDLSDRFSAYAGFNHMKQPIDAATLSPTLAIIGEKHLTLGGVSRFGANHQIAAGVEYLFPSKVTYSNPQVPLGSNLTGRMEYLAAHFMYSYLW